MPSLGENPTTFLHLVSGNIHGGPGKINITEEEAQRDITKFNSLIINENKTVVDMKASIGGIIEAFKISNETEINAMKYSFNYTNSYHEEMRNKFSKRSFEGYLNKWDASVSVAFFTVWLV